jgi:hypothetical protein
VRLSKELLELVVLGFKLSKLGSVGRLHAAKTGAPLIEGWLAKATGPAKFLDGHARVSLFEEANDWLIGKSGLFHSRYSPKLADFVPSLWYGREGAGHWGNTGEDTIHFFALAKSTASLRISFSKVLRPSAPSSCLMRLMAS